MKIKKVKPTIIFFGTPDFAVASLEALIENDYPVLAVVTAVDKLAGRGQKIRTSPVKDYAQNRNLPILQPEKLKNPGFLETLKQFNADLHVVVAFRMLPESVWDMPPLGTINVHASYLPLYRGAAPINWALINGEKTTGVTTFQLRHEIDMGNILLREQIPVLPEDDFGSLYEKLKTRGATLLIKTLAKLSEGALSPLPQELTGNEPTAPKLDKNLPQIHWNMSAKRIVNLIKGLSPVPGAYTRLEGKKLKIFKAEVQSFREHSSPSKAGDFYTDGRSVLQFAAEDAWVRVLDLQYEGKKRMAVRDFLSGWRSPAKN